MVFISSPDLDMSFGIGVNLLVGMRFNGLNIPTGANIINSHIQYEVDAVTTNPASLIFRGEAVDSAATFSAALGDISGRILTTDSVNWNNVPAWTTIGAIESSPDLGIIIQEIIDRPGWTSGNSMAIIVEGTTSEARIAKAWDQDLGSPANAPILTVSYNLPSFPEHYITTVDTSTLPPGFILTTDTVESIVFTANGQTLSDNDFGFKYCTLTVTAGSNSPACVGADINLTESGGDAVSWAWTGPNGFSSAQQNPTISASSNVNEGNYMVRVTDVNGCIDSSTVAVTIDALPVVNATSNSPICEGDTLTLFESGGDGVGWSWTGPNGFSSNLQNPVIMGATVAATGDYFVVVSKPGDCSATTGVTVVVDALPTVSLSLSDTTACQSETTLALNGENPIGGAFSGSGVSGTNFDPSAAGTGTHIITYTYTDGNGCVASGVDSIEVFGLPSVSLTLSDQEECVNSTISTLSGGSPAVGTYSGTGVSGGNFNASIAGLGVHTITYTYTNGDGCINTATDEITVVNLPTVSLLLGEDTDCVTDNILALTGGAPAGGTYSGPGVTGNNFDASTAGAGVHTISYTYTDVSSGCTNTATDNITVFSLPTVSLNLPDLEDCVLNTSLALSGGLPSGGTFSGPGVGGVNFDASAAGLGIHTITYTYTDANGCTNTATQDITVVAPPTVTLTLATDEDCVANSTLVLSGGSPAGGTYSGPGVSGDNFSASSAGVGTPLPLTKLQFMVHLLLPR